MIIITRIYECIMLLHEYGIYHSDIKPDNIAFYYDVELGKYGLKLIDFGGASTDF